MKKYSSQRNMASVLLGNEWKSRVKIPPERHRKTCRHKKYAGFITKCSLQKNAGFNAAKGVVMVWQHLVTTWYIGDVIRDEICTILPTAARSLLPCLGYIQTHLSESWGRICHIFQLSGADPLSIYRDIAVWDSTLGGHWEKSWQTSR